MSNNKSTDWSGFAFANTDGNVELGYWRWCDGRVIVLTRDPDCPIFDDVELEDGDPYDEAIREGDIWTASEYVETAFEVTRLHLSHSIEHKPQRFEHLRAGLVTLEEAKEIAPTLL